LRFFIAVILSGMKNLSKTGFLFSAMPFCFYVIVSAGSTAFSVALGMTFANHRFCTAV